MIQYRLRPGSDPSALTEILKKFGEANIWQFESKDTVQLVKSGLESEICEAVIAAQKAQDTLLRRELFIFLDI